MEIRYPFDSFICFEILFVYHPPVILNPSRYAQAKFNIRIIEETVEDGPLKRKIHGSLSCFYLIIDNYLSLVPIFENYNEVLKL